MGRLEERLRKWMGDKVMPQKKSDQDAAAAAPTGHQAATGTA